VAAWLAGAALQGLFPDGARIEPTSSRQILWIPTEGRIAELTDRLKALDVPLDKVFRPLMDDDPHAEFDPTDEAWLELMAELASEEYPFWVIVDQIPLSALMTEIGCAATVLCEKDGEIRGTDAVRRWAEIVGRMQTVVSITGWAPDSEDLRLRVTRTDGERPDPLRVRLHDGIPEVVDAAPTAPRTVLECALDLLERRLVRGPQPAGQLIELAKSDGISRRTVARAKQQLGVMSFQVDGHWYWILP
jgi:hypothetical protein